jgi:hypothetical protein
MSFCDPLFICLLVNKSRDWYLTFNKDLPSAPEEPVGEDYEYCTDDRPGDGNAKYKKYFMLRRKVKAVREEIAQHDAHKPEQERRKYPLLVISGHELSDRAHNKCNDKVIQQL